MTKQSRASWLSNRSSLWHDGRPAAVMFAFAILAQGSGGGLPTAKRAGVHYAAVPSPWPSNRACINQERGAIVAKEVLMGRTRTCVVAGGEAAISDEAWATFTP